MAVGQRAFSVAADVAALDALELELAVGELDRGAQHVGSLRRVLRMHAVFTSSGTSFSTVPHAALAMGCSEHRAGTLLTEALGLAELPGGLEAVECGLLTVEQSEVLVRQLAPLPLPVRLVVWRRLQVRLCERGVLPPARLTELLRRWILAADPDGAQERRRAAEEGRRIDYRRRDDGLHDLFALGFRGPDLQAVLSRIAARSAPVSVWDDRTADQRRFDACKDLLLGRESLPLDSEEAGGAPGGAAACGCPPGSPVPCGVEVLVHMRWEAGLGMSDEPAELVGHGPIEPDLLEELLLASPRLRAVWTDEHGVPVAVDDRVVVPPRGDPQELRQALLELAKRPQPARQPRTPDDHPPPRGAPDDSPGTDTVVEGPPRAHRLDPTSTEHPPDGSGPYRPPRRVRRLTTTRATRCEWPGCGARAVVCDAEHDLAWPDGPTCACNLGPCCRRHHRVKQCGWVKARHVDGSITWTSPTGRAWLAPAQHQPPATPTRPLRPVPTPCPWDEMDPAEVENQLWVLDLLPDDHLRNAATPVDEDVPDTDRLGRRIESGDTRWTLDLEDPYRWLDAELDPSFS